MFGRGKRGSSGKSPLKSNQVMNQDQGMFGIPALSEFAAKDNSDVSNEALEAELAALLDEEAEDDDDDSSNSKSQEQGRPAPAKRAKTAHTPRCIEAMAADAMKNDEVDDEDNGGDDDDDLLAELANTTEETEDSSPGPTSPPAAQSTVARVPSPGSPAIEDQGQSAAPAQSAPSPGNLVPGPSAIKRDLSPIRRPILYPQAPAPSAATMIAPELMDLNSVLQTVLRTRGLLFQQPIENMETAGEESKVRRYKRQLKECTRNAYLTYFETSDDSSEDNVYDSDEDYAELDSEISDSEDDMEVVPGEVSRPVTITSPSGLGVKVATTKNRNGCRKWNKHDYCMFCMKQDGGKLPRHLFTYHSQEPEVQQVARMPLNSKERKDMFQLLRNNGNHAHNLDVLARKEGYLIPRKRPTYEIDPSEFLPCDDCLGWFIATDMWKHKKKCIMRNEGKRASLGKSLRGRCAMLLPMSTDASEALKENVIKRMTPDEVSMAARNDDLIVKFGVNILGTTECTAHLYQHVSQKMREMGRLLLKVQQINPSIRTMKDCIDPCVFDDVVHAVHVVSGLNISNGNYAAPSLALKLGHGLKKCAHLVKVDAIRLGDGGKVLRAKAEDFAEMCKIVWSQSVSKNALSTLDERKWNLPSMLPVASDVEKVHEILTTTVTKKKTSLQENPQDTDYIEMCRAVLTQIVLFNRRRSGEVERMRVKDFKNHSDDRNEDIMQGLPAFERHLCGMLSRVEIEGKRGCKVPILLTSEMVQNLEVLLASRQAVGVLEESTFMFARPGCATSYRGAVSLRKFVSACGAQHPTYITSTRLREHVATMSQVLCLKDREFDVLADFLGRNIQVHQNLFHPPENTLQMAKVAKIVMLLEKGHASQFAGKLLDEIEVDLDEPISLEADHPSHDTTAARGDTASATSEGESTGGEDDNTAEEAEQPAKVSDKPAQTPVFKNIKGKSRSQKKMSWTPDERNAVDEFFSEHVRLMKVPRRHECEQCKRENPVLGRLDWSLIKFRIHNEIAKQKRKMMGSNKW